MRLSRLTRQQRMIGLAGIAVGTMFGLAGLIILLQILVAVAGH